MTAPAPLADRNIPVSELAAGALCIAASGTFLALAFALPDGHSRGDVGPGALPEQIGIFGLLCSAIYLVLTLRGAFPGVKGKFADAPRALASFAIFALGMIVVPWLGLALSLATAAAGLTLLFQGDRRWLRAAATGITLWLIATLLFQRLLGLPLP
ncbi:tripartite tricarboxylate transporter TctB family protein [Paracoccus sp. MBLB3053]|uniref:Tripartite tricarboxylate transporter TctB family protein n=1 Tax=Paracoccus aurantius TaxID=3073814 RepID=A0ABU2HUT5_9RHOB|nr:tripartite tricarboxylate transporter TctB family protein [Paracoccus sp. MBLB3053]MDS9468818.1 tripartite tricarboxylate transporter TctB family protein [Paracoccus sp. MBLB3053]